MPCKLCDRKIDAKANLKRKVLFSVFILFFFLSLVFYITATARILSCGQLYQSANSFSATARITAAARILSCGYSYKSKNSKTSISSSKPFSSA